MTEKELELLGFKKEDSLDVSDGKPMFYFYHYKIAKGLELVSCCSDELVNHEWYVEFVDSEPRIVYDNFGELQGVINMLEKAKL